MSSKSVPVVCIGPAGLALTFARFVDCRVAQNAVDEAAQVAAYIDARLVFDRLDHVCGDKWSARFYELPEALIRPPVDRNGELKEPPPVYVRCRLTLYRVTREDVGEGQDPKAAFSDAIKRAAVHFGVGRALYAMRLPWLREDDAESELRRNRKGKLVLDRRTEDWCRGMYERWLEGRGRRQFGEPLDHGDETGAQGFERERRPGGQLTDQMAGGSIRARGAGGRPGRSADPGPRQCPDAATASCPLTEPRPSSRPRR